METNAILRMLRPLRLAARRFVTLPDEPRYTGEHGCIRAAASFLAWNQIEGDYLEFGVYQGDSFATAYHSIFNQRRLQASFVQNGSHRPERPRPRFFAFDSFSGLPQAPGASHADYGAGAYACGRDKFTRNIQKRGLNLKDVVVVPGYYDRTLTPETKERYGLRRAALVMIDCDLYESTVPVLDFLTDLIDQGTILIFHDWFRYQGNPKYGEQRACREWLDRNPQFELIEYWREGPQAVSFLVSRR
jgi:hypothetical protein